MNIVVHIERLILDGFAVDELEPEQIQFALQQELTRLLTEGGMANELAAGGAFASRQTEPIAKPAPQAPAFGAQIAESLYSALGGQKGAE